MSVPHIVERLVNRAEEDCRLHPDEQSAPHSLKGAAHVLSGQDQERLFLGRLASLALSDGENLGIAAHRAPPTRALRSAWRAARALAPSLNSRPGAVTALRTRAHRWRRCSACSIAISARRT